MGWGSRAEEQERGHMFPEAAEGGGWEGKVEGAEGEVCSGWELI